MTERPEDTFGQAVAHLSYLGYEVGPPDPDGWSYAQHPMRYDFHLRAFAMGIRLHCATGIGAATGNSRAAWLHYLNTANEQSRITQFWLSEDQPGVHRVRMRAFVSGAYSRPVFAMMMDMWHEDLDLIRRKPDFPPAESASEDEDVAAVTVN
jgi:hypothetical protein